MKDLEIETLVIEADREEHITKHRVSLEEVIEIVTGDYVYIQGKLGRWLLIGKTKKKRFLTVVLGQRKKKNTYGLVTTRPSRREEKSFYNELAHKQGGEYDDKN